MLFLLCVVIFIHQLPLPAHSKCEDSFSCGDMSSLEFPLSPTLGCGIFTVNCASRLPIFKVGPEVELEIQNKISENTFRVRDTYLDRMLGKVSSEMLCHSLWLYPHEVYNIPFVSFSINSSINLTLVSCPMPLATETRIKYKYNSHKFKNFSQCDAVELFYNDPTQADPNPIPPECHLVHMPIKSGLETGTDLLDWLSPEFDVEFIVSPECMACHRKGGVCVTDASNQFLCQAISTAAAFLGLCSAAFFLLYCCKKNNGRYRIGRKKRYDLFTLQKQIPKTQKAVEQLFNNSGTIPARRYKYLELKRITNSFTHESGRGGFGIVYKGKLPDNQQLVAVKILNKQTEGGEEFMNEVASISRTSHVNIVTLLGYCIEGSKRALIYEFMPNV